MQPGTRLEDIYGPGEIRVNSYHHQGVRKLAPNFRVAALAPDGLIEAFEGKDPSWWVTGVQWHPENEGNISLDMQLIEAFVAASASRAAPRPSPRSADRLACLSQWAVPVVRQYAVKTTRMNTEDAFASPPCTAYGSTAYC